MPPPPALKRIFCLLMLGGFAATAFSAEPSAATKSSDPTEISFEDLVKMEIPTVEAASKYKQKTTEAPSSITIITSDEVKKYGHRTLADILASAPGLHVSYDRNYSFLGVRGFNLGDNNNRVLLLVDGHRINNSLSDSAYLGTEFLLDVDLIDRVEIIRGPGSSLYGNNAFFGVINVVTRRGRDLNGVEVSGEAGSFDTFKGRVTLGKQFTNGLELLLSGSLLDSGGDKNLFYKEYNTPANNNGIAHDADADASKNFFGSLTFHDFTLEGAWAKREKNNPTAQYLADFNDNRLMTTDERSYASLKFAHEFPDVVNVTAQLYYDRHNLDIDEPFGGVLYRDEQAAEWWGAELTLTKRLWDKHTLTFGGEYRDDFTQTQRYLSLDTGDVFKDLSRDRTSYGIYLEGNFEIVTNLHFTAGARYDQYGDYDPTVNPRLALIWNPFEQTTLKAIYGTAFRAPNFFELSDTRNQNIQPETIRTYELVYEQGIGNHLRSSVAGFYNQIDDIIYFNSEPGHQRFENLPRANAKGVELALNGEWAGGVRGRVSYTLQETENETTGRTMTDSPQHLAKLNLSAPIVKEKLFAGLEVQFVSQRTTTHINALGTAEAGGDAPAYGIVNFTLFSQNLIKGMDVSAGVYNLLDRTYSDPSTRLHLQDLIEQDGRTFRVKLTYRF